MKRRDSVADGGGGYWADHRELIGRVWRRVAQTQGVGSGVQQNPGLEAGTSAGRTEPSPVVSPDRLGEG